MKHPITTAIAVPLILLLAACQSGEQGGEEGREEGGAPPETVEERAQSRWDAMVAGEFDDVWSFETPGFRDQVEQTAFAQDMKRRPVDWVAARVVGSSCEETDKCRVTAEITYRAQVPGQRSEKMEMTRDLDEDWIRLEGQWWHVQN
jgi:hypothetical protein